MKRTMVILATLASAGIAHAQTSTTPPSPGTTTTTPGAAAVSLSSARSKIEASGYSNVTNLKQDSAGQWTAQATKSGKQVAVMVDSKGMVREAQQ